MQNKSVVELYWERLTATAGEGKPWNELTPNQQNAVVHSINLIITVLEGHLK